MNTSKRVMLIVVIVLNFLNAALNIFLIVRNFNYYQQSEFGLVTLIYDFISIAGFLTSAGLLIYAISNKGQFFRQRNGYYMTAVTISLCMSLFSVSSILLVITLFMSDLVWVKPHDDVYFGGENVNEKKKEKELPEKEKERKIARLRELRDKGTITEEEFKEELLKLL